MVKRYYYFRAYNPRTTGVSLLQPYGRFTKPPILVVSSSVLLLLVLVSVNPPVTIHPRAPELPITDQPQRTRNLSNRFAPSFAQPKSQEMKRHLLSLNDLTSTPGEWSSSKLLRLRAVFLLIVIINIIHFILNRHLLSAGLLPLPPSFADIRVREARVEQRFSL